MNKKLKIIFYILFLIIPIQTGQAASLDDIYRDIVRDDNSGYLPIFVKNRNRPELLFEDKIPNEQEKKATNKPVVKLTDERKIKQDAIKAEQARWQATIKAIQENKFTAKDLKMLDEYVEKGDSKAIEIKAWMLAKGYGIKQDLTSAFFLYRKAEKLGVPNALKNAAQVYRAMSREQRENLITAKK